MLTEEEVKELKKLSPELREKIESMFSSPYYLGFMAADSQFNKFCKDSIENPQSISGDDEDYSQYKDNDNFAETVAALSAQKRQKAETALKINKSLYELIEVRERFRVKLTPDEQQKANLLTTTSDVRKATLNNGD